MDPAAAGAEPPAVDPRDRELFEAGRKAQWSGYDYQVPGGWHGRFQNLRVIGDKRGGASTRRLRHSPELIDRVREIVGVPVRVVHAIRNPYDNIASKHKRHPRRGLEKMMREYFRACRTNAELKRRLGDSVLDLRHEDLMASPRERLTELCRFLGVEPTSEYLDGCTTLLYSEPHRSRHDVSWSPELLAEVQRRIGKYDFLAGYDFDS